jgi:hypothetical protein
MQEVQEVQEVQKAPSPPPFCTCCTSCMRCWTVYLARGLPTGSREHPGHIADQAADADVAIKLVARHTGEVSAEVSFGHLVNGPSGPIRMKQRLS